MKKSTAFFGVVCAALLAGCSHQTTSPTPATSPSVVVSPPPPVAPPLSAPPAKAVIYTVDETHGTDANNYLVPEPITLTNAEDPAREAVRALLTAPHTPCPKGTRLIGIKTADGLATVDFSRSPVDETHGEEKQTQALEALQMTLGQFQKISRIQITVHGQPLPSIGEADGGPMDVIRPDEKPQETGGA